MSPFEPEGDVRAPAARTCSFLREPSGFRNGKVEKMHPTSAEALACGGEWARRRRWLENHA
jgi:hypothetical protein